MKIDSVVKHEKISLKNSQISEEELQDYIDKDPSVLGLGDLRVLSREHKQSSGGRIDFLMIDDESNVIYEVEIMLGKLDESHIIRTIEYWDIESRKRPNYEHIAVIVAEDITNRFFNVISLLNRSIPIMAIQLDALAINDNLILNFTKVLDTYEQYESVEEIDEKPDADRTYWEGLSSKDSIETFDQVVSLYQKENESCRPIYRRRHIALYGPSKKAANIHLRKSNKCMVSFLVGREKSDEAYNLVEEAGLSVTKSRKNMGVRLSVSKEEMGKFAEIYTKLIEMSVEYSS